LPNGTAYNYEYTLADHLGNSRLNFDDVSNTAHTEQQDNYMPFGLDISVGGINPPQNYYLYNNKELQSGLGLYDYGARFYDPVTARWTSMDPLEENNRPFNPYNYCKNNPMLNIDPNGMGDGPYGEDLSELRNFESLSSYSGGLSHAGYNPSPPANDAVAKAARRALFSGSNTQTNLIDQIGLDPLNKKPPLLGVTFTIVLYTSTETSPIADGTGTETTKTYIGRIFSIGPEGTEGDYNTTISVKNTVELESFEIDNKWGWGITGDYSDDEVGMSWSNKIGGYSLGKDPYTGYIEYGSYAREKSGFIFGHITEINFQKGEENFKQNWWNFSHGGIFKLWPSFLSKKFWNDPVFSE
jgi:RHS repeat-associated protein